MTLITVARSILYRPRNLFLAFIGVWMMMTVCQLSAKLYLQSRLPAVYLVPMLTGGPNNQYTGMAEIIALAHILKLTVILPDFYEHYYFRKNNSTPIQRHPYERTFDTSALPIKWLPFSYFESKCEGSTNLLIDLSDSGICDSQPTDTIQGFENYKTPSVVHCYTSINDTRTKLQDLLQRVAANPGCIGIRTFRRLPINLIFPYFRYLPRTPEVRHIAERFRASVPGPLIVCHIRPMDPPRSELLCNNETDIEAFPQCTYNETIASLAPFLRKAQRLYKITTVYIATPVIDIAKSLRKKLRGNTFMMEDLLLLVPKAHREDLYFLSLLEQEIAFGADVFVNWPSSTWSTLVVNQRMIHKPHLPNRDIPGVMPLRTCYEFSLNISGLMRLDGSRIEGA